MTKQITKERLIATLDKIDKNVPETFDMDGEIVQLLCTFGIRSMVKEAFGQEVTQLDHIKHHLEFKYRDLPNTLTEVFWAKERWFDAINKKHDRAHKVYLIQAKHKVSGLELGNMTLGNKTIQCWQESDRLQLVSEDLPQMRQTRQKVVDLFFSVIKESTISLVLYRHDDVGGFDQWIPAEPTEAYLSTVSYDWASAWGDCYFTSPRQMKEKGYDQFRREPVYPDDERHIEYHLSLSCGLDTQTCNTDRAWYCASNKVPTL